MEENRFYILSESKKHATALGDYSYFYPPRSRTVRVMKGRQFQLFTKESQQAFFREPFTVTSDSDRMGYRLTGPTLSLTKKFEMISEGVAFGSIQVPASGDPIVFSRTDRRSVDIRRSHKSRPLTSRRSHKKKPGDEIALFQKLQLKKLKCSFGD